jgi:hypothetical protein
MGDVRLVVKRLALGAKAQPVEAKAFEYMRLASARLGPSGLGKVSLAPQEHTRLPQGPRIPSDHPSPSHRHRSPIRSLQAEVCKAAVCVDLACTT